MKILQTNNNKVVSIKVLELGVQPNGKDCSSPWKALSRCLGQEGKKEKKKRKKYRKERKMKKKKVKTSEIGIEFKKTLPK